mgnify:FL=1
MNLSAAIRAWLANERMRRAWLRRWRTWKRDNPAGNRAQFYAFDAVALAARGAVGKPRTLGLRIDPAQQEPRALILLEALRAGGLSPHHLLVDYGCGSLWVGEVLMRYLNRGRYIGLDVVDRFYEERLPLLPAGLLEQKQPELRVIAPDVLAAVQARRPDVLLANKVLMHVQPPDLAEFFASLLATTTSETRILVQHRWQRRSRRHHGVKWWHSHRRVERAAARVGCEIRWPRAKGDPLKEVHLFELRRLSAR